MATIFRDPLYVSPGKRAFVSSEIPPNVTLRLPVQTASAPFVPSTFQQTFTRKNVSVDLPPNLLTSTLVTQSSTLPANTDWESVTYRKYVSPVDIPPNVLLKGIPQPFPPGKSIFLETPKRKGYQATDQVENLLLTLLKLNVQSFSYTGSGGLTFGGSALEVRVKVEPTSGGLTFGGTAPVSFVGVKSFTYTGSGGFVFGGSAVEVRKVQILPSGGLTFGGTAPYSQLPAGGTGNLQFNHRGFFTFLKPR